MASLEAIREGIATNLRVIGGIQVSAYMLSNPTPPAAHVFPDEISYDQAMQRGHDNWDLLVQVFVAEAGGDIGAQKRLDQMLAPSGPDSVKEAIEADLTLGGLISDLHVVSCSGYRIYPLARGGQVLGAEWKVRVLA